MSPPWQFFVDRGGTFTDIIGIAPEGAFHVAKLLSSDTAPVEGIRTILARQGAAGVGTAGAPPVVVKLGTTVATNALLERRGVSTLFVTNRGLGDLLRIGTQQRPELFDLAIEEPRPVHSRVLEVSGRRGAGGEVVEVLDTTAAREGLSEARQAGLESVAIALIHAYAEPADEEILAALARDCGFETVVTSSGVAREMGLLARGATACVDAYLTPLLQRHVRSLRDALPGATLRFMQSSGGLTDGARFRGPAALLSGPAGGVVGAARVAAAAGFGGAVGFDMGGTSTDVSLIVDGAVERSFESRVGGVRVKAPMLRIHTIAAGGGSLCRFDGYRLTVGPESAGADPGPLCYGRRTADGRPAASELALTDVNLQLGRVPGDRFPFELDEESVARGLEGLAAEMREAGHDYDADAIAAGFVEIANHHMAQAIQEVSVRRGVDPRDFALVGFGGAGGQHVCAVARRLGIRTVLLHPHAGLLSAYGIGVAERSWDGQRDAGRTLLPAGSGPLPDGALAILAGLRAEARRVLEGEGIAAASIELECSLDLRYAGTESALDVAEPEDGDWRAAFEAAHASRFGYRRPDRTVEIVTARVHAWAAEGARPAVAAVPVTEPARPVRETRAWFPDAGWRSAPVYRREGLASGQQIAGPALVLEETGTVVLDPGFEAAVGRDGTLLIEDRGASEPRRADLSHPDPVRLEVFGSRFMSIAEQMGAVLCNTAVSTNIRDRLDYSCAVFDRAGGLVANAPHIPVHLGAMGETVRSVRDGFPDLAEGEVVVTNDPFAGGSHLPDVTVVTPVFLGGPAPRFFVASRGHHADLGGSTPGSMPADSRSLAEEGVLIEAFRLVVDGRLDEERVRAVLAGGRYPARSPDDNLADLEAMVAANRTGETLLRGMVEALGTEAVEVTMGQLQRAAGEKVAREIGRLPDGEHSFEDAMDDGTPVCARLRVTGERMEIDFSGTGPAQAGNLNAPRAVVSAAVLYVLRALVAERIPLNGGCLEPVTIRIPPGSLLDPPPGSAVVGGNVETSQRVVDVLLGALGLQAASQGTMNNVAFGDARFGYYETIGGGAGAGRDFPGASCVHTHMTNTRITDPEVLEVRFPVRLHRFARRSGSGGAGRQAGGDGLVRCYEFLAPVTVSLLTERRTRPPFGLEGGEPGRRGRNRLLPAQGEESEVGGHATLHVGAGDRLIVETPGGGGFGPPSP